MTLIDLLDQAGLTGRGGAAFRTAIKVRAAAEHGATLIVNACDGEIGATKDAWVVENQLDGLLGGARLVAGDHPIRVAAHRGSRAAALLAAAGVDVLEVPARYVSSEESALISLANGGLARPMTKRAPFVAGGRDARGRRIPPTVVLNAETVWRIAQIAEHGPDWFRRQGTALEPGPRLVTLTGAVAAPHVIETAAGARLGDLFGAAGGLLDAELVWVGGLAGVLIPAPEAARLLWSSTDLASYGGSIGSGVVWALDPAECPVAFVDHMLTYAAGESAGQCGPCMFGLPALAADWHDLAGARSGRAVDAADRLAARVALLPDRGACRYPDGIARFAASAARVLAGHLDQHARGTCPPARTTRSLVNA